MRDRYAARPDLLRWLRAPLHLLGSLLPLLPLIGITAFWMSPVTPYLLWEYTYQDEGSLRLYQRCTYVSAHGAINRTFGSDCPVIVLLHWKEAQLESRPNAASRSGL